MGEDALYPTMCKEQTDDIYTAPCHRDGGHKGAHRGFKVGVMTAVYWLSVDSPLLTYGPNGLRTLPTSYE